jgi:hypothetical protein
MWSVIYGVGSGASFFYMLELARTILKGYEYDYVDKLLNGKLWTVYG